jgi:hypothetical protein
MALLPLKLPRLQQGRAIVNAQGQPTTEFLTLVNTAFSAVETAVNQTAQNVLDLQDAFAAIRAVNTVAQAAQTAANTAQETADQSGGGTALSGSNTSIVSPQTSAWENGPQVDLTGVTAGNLTISGSGPIQDDTLESAATITGNFRIVEIVGMVETTVFTGSYMLYQGNPGTVVNQSASTVSAFSAARSSTGAVSYRLDANRTDGGVLVTPIDMALYLFVRRS